MATVIEIRIIETEEFEVPNRRYDEGVERRTKVQKNDVRVETESPEEAFAKAVAYLHLMTPAPVIGKVEFE